MAVATAVATQERQDTEAQRRLRSVVTDVQRLLKSTPGAELAEARDQLEKVGIKVRQELYRAGLPLSPSVPAILNPAEHILSQAEVEQQERILHAVALLELAREVRAQANVALFQAR